MVIKTSDLLMFLHTAVQNKLSGITEIFLPSSPRWEAGPVTQFSPLKTATAPILDSFRTVDPVKILFYLTRERLNDDRQPPKRLIVGVKACDLKALLLLDDALMNGDVVDPVYAAWRQNSIVVASDCGDIGETCHCTLVDGKPWSEAGFDVNLAAAGDTYWATAGSAKGEELLQLISAHVKTVPDDPEIIQQVEARRQAIVERLRRQNQPFERDARYPKYRFADEAVWKAGEETCVGCGACTNICPTCYCLILNDESKDGRFIKERSYDSCQWNGYARVAGGGTPRPKMVDRFRNRYLCKFDYMEHNFGRIGCTGCGRCTEACAGKIDFRKVVKSVETALQAA